MAVQKVSGNYTTLVYTTDSHTCHSRERDHTYIVCHSSKLLHVTNEEQREREREGIPKFDVG